MLTYLLIGFIIALALAPLTHFIPSKRQRRAASMREYAALHGLFVEFRELPGASRRAPVRPGEIIYYGKRLPAARLEPASYGHWLREESSWRSGDRRADVPEYLTGLPTCILAASVDQGGCGIYWIESSEEEHVQQICAVLDAWGAGLSGAETAPE